MEPVKKLNATKVPGPKKKLVFFAIAVFRIKHSGLLYKRCGSFDKIQHHGRTACARIRGALALSAYHDLCHRCCNTRKIDGIYFLVAVCCARLLCSSAIGKRI